MEHKDQISGIKELRSKNLPIDKTLIKKLIWTILLVFDVVCSLIKIPLMSMVTLFKMIFPIEKNVQGQLVLVNCEIKVLINNFPSYQINIDFVILTDYWRWKWFRKSNWYQISTTRM